MMFPAKNIIPSQLHNPAFRFIKVEKGGKRPIEQQWTNQKNYSYNDPILQEWLKDGGNYGVLGGYGNLVIVDFDDLACAKAVDVPKTFVAKSGGKGMPHVYFILDKQIAKYPIKNGEHKTLIDVQGMGAQVVGPGSKLSTGGQYSVVEQDPITSITEEQLYKMLEPVAGTQHAPEVKKKPMHFPYVEKDDEVSRIKKQVRMSEVVSTMGIDVRRRPCMCPLGHSSVGGKCFSITDDVGLACCHNCGFGGDIFKLVMVKKNISFKEALAWVKEEFRV
jgi:hypothetical protein